MALLFPTPDSGEGVAVASAGRVKPKVHVVTVVSWSDGAVVMVTVGVADNS